MRDQDLLQEELHLQKLQLHWLLQITKAINYDLPSQQLFDIYETVMRDHLHASNLILFINESVWKEMLWFGIEDYDQIDFLKAHLHELDTMQINNLSLPQWVNGFESIVPVYHNGKPLAYAFLGALKEQATIRELLPFIHTITNIIVVAIENKRLTRETISQAQLQREMELAAKMQAMLFPSFTPHISRLDVATTYLPHQQVGGDYYDYIEISDDELLVCLADVSGKGISAALLMSNFQANLHAKTGLNNDLIRLMHELNENVNKSAKGEKFITVFIGIINTKTRLLRYVNAGQNPPFIFQNNEFVMLDKGTTGLGMFEQLPFINEGLIHLHKGAMLMCYTDGIVEQENTDKEIYGMERLMDLIRTNVDVYTMKDLHFRILDDFNAFSKNAESLDDVTLLSCRLLV